MYNNHKDHSKQGEGIHILDFRCRTFCMSYLKEKFILVYDLCAPPNYQKILNDTSLESLLHSDPKDVIFVPIIPNP